MELEGLRPLAFINALLGAISQLSAPEVVAGEAIPVSLHANTAAKPPWLIYFGAPCEGAGLRAPRREDGIFAAGVPMSDDRLALLYEKYGPVIYARCRRMLADDAAAEDATQEIFVRVAKHLDDAPTSVDALLWIYRIASNHCLNELRNRKRRPQPSGSPLPEGADRGESRLADRDLARKIIERAPERVRASAWLYHVDGLSYDEVGKALGVSRRTVINYLAEFEQRAMKFLGRQL